MLHFKKPKQEDQASVHNESLSLSLLVAGLKYVNSVSVYFQFDKNLYIIDFCGNLPNNSIQKQVKAPVVYPLMDLLYKKTYIKAIDDQCRRETLKQIF